MLEGASVQAKNQGQDHAFRERLLIDPKEHPILLAELFSNSQKQRERTTELMFESHKVPALFLAKNAVLTSFASGRPTSLVMDQQLLLQCMMNMFFKRLWCLPPLAGGFN